MNLNVIWKLLSATYTKWTEDHAQGLGAALAFYAVVSLAPLLLIVIAIAGSVFGQEAAQGQIHRADSRPRRRGECESDSKHDRRSPKARRRHHCHGPGHCHAASRRNRCICSTSGSSEYDLES